MTHPELAPIFFLAASLQVCWRLRASGNLRANSMNIEYWCPMVSIWPLLFFLQSVVIYPISLGVPKAGELPGRISSCDLCASQICKSCEARLPPLAIARKCSTHSSKLQVSGQWRARWSTCRVCSRFALDPGTPWPIKSKQSEAATSSYRHPHFQTFRVCFSTIST